MRNEGPDTKSGGTGLWVAGVVIAVLAGAGVYMSSGSQEDLGLQEVATGGDAPAPTPVTEPVPAAAPEAPAVA
ncbi:hypothetical protein, partial [Roseobacter sp.]